MVEETLVGRRCLVTGATGHLGSYVTSRLVEAGARTTVLVRQESDLWRLWEILDEIEVARADLSEPATLDEALASAAPEYVFHLGWGGVTGEREDPEQVTGNVTGSLALLRAAAETGCECFVGLGSQAEYGPSDGILTEDLPARPVTAYGVGKLCAGMLTGRLAAMLGVRHVWLRLLATYGPKDDGRRMIPTVVERLLRGEVPALTEGLQRWDYLYVEDAAEAICQSAVGAPTGVYNLASGEARAVREVVEKIRDLVDPALSLGFGEVPYSPGQVMRLEANISKLRRATGWEPGVGLGEGLRRTIEWHRSRVMA
jgi:nucleoside-diphosphate-sugar epimerase